MELLFKREQTTGKLRRVTFKLWAKLELDDDEQALIARYHFDEAILIDAIQPKLLRNTALLAIAASAAFYLIAQFILPDSVATFGALVAAVGAGYWYYHNNRESIFVRDLLHGRHFSCDTVIELAQKEAWLATIVAFLRQVMESAKHWDGTERHTIEPLPKNEARQVILKGI